MISDNYYPLLMNFARKMGILYLDTCPPFYWYSGCHTTVQACMSPPCRPAVVFF